MLDVQGQSPVITQLQRALNSGRLAHTWIFAGPPGVGKFRLAMELSKAALCDQPRKRANQGALPQLPVDFQWTLPCGTCDSCKAIHPDTARNSHPDLHIITKELIRYHDRGGKSKGTTISIDVIRGEITGDPDAGKEPKMAKRSFRGKGKWFIIDEADLMEAPAQNCLLKTLEEPPAQSFLVLISDSPNELLPTIRSRSQLATFRELPIEVIVPALIARGISNPDAQLLARIAHGSLGRAVRFAQDIETITARNAQEVARKAKREETAEEDDEKTTLMPGGVLAWVRLLANQLDAFILGQATASDVGTAINQSAAQFTKLQLIRDPLTSKDQATRQGIAFMLALAADWFDDRLRQSLGVSHEMPLPGETAALEPAVARELIRAARQGEAQLDMNANVSLVLTATCTAWEELLRAPVAAEPRA